MNSRSVRPGRARPGATALLLAVLAVAMSGLFAACGSVTVSAITVNGTSVSRTDFEKDISALSASAKLKALDKTVAQQSTSAQRLFDDHGAATRALTTSWLNRLANELVIDREFDHLHLTLSSTDQSEGKSQFAQLFASGSDNGTSLVAQFPKWFQSKEELHEARLVAVTTVLEKKHPITRTQELAFYTQNVASLCPSGVNVAHILVKTLAEAQAIEAQLQGGAKFSDLATAKSIDTGSAQQGGSLGCLGSGEFVTEFQNAAEAAKIGVPTAPVKSQYGYHVILTTKYVPPTFDALESQIRQQLLSQANLAGKYVASKLKTASVKIAAQYGTWDAKNGTAVAPTVPKVSSSRPSKSTTTTAVTPTS